MKKSPLPKALFLSWKDILHPAAGGAELYTDAIATHMAETYEVTYFTSYFPGARPTEHHHGYTIIRKGTVYTTIIHAWVWWHLHGRSKGYSLIIDQVHGVPFFSTTYSNKPKTITLIYEIAGALWSRIVPLWIGLLLDACWLALYKNQQFATISASTQHELIERGISKNHIHMLPLFIPAPTGAIPQKPSAFHFAIVGRIAPVKRIERAISAFRIFQLKHPTSTLTITGRYETAYASYAQLIEQSIALDPAIQLTYNSSEEQKQTILKQAHILLMPSEKEGYGIVILEAAACGTPAIGYNVPGIRDAIQPNITGIIADQETPESLANCMQHMLIDPVRYKTFQDAAYALAQRHDISHTIQSWDTILHTVL